MKKGKNKTPKNVESMSKEQLAATLEAKRECNGRAQSVVENMLEGKMEESEFLEKLWYINETHMDDIIQERAILKHCGYPICGQALLNIPDQKYHISAKSNKVFDLTERKLFCSNHCYGAAVFIKKQMLTSPLWLRDVEIKPNFHLLRNCVDKKGEEVDVSIIERELEKKVNAGKKEISPSDLEKSKLKSEKATIVSGKEQIVLSGKEKTVLSGEGKEPTDVGKDQSLINRNLGVIQKYESDCQIEQNVTGIMKTFSKQSTKSDIKKQSPIKCPTVKNTDRYSMKQEKQENSVIALRDHIETCITEWFTIDALLYILGEEKVKAMCEKDKDIEDIKQKLINKQNDEKIFNLCKKLNFLSFSDMGEGLKTLKPLPDYSMIKYDSENLQVKVRSFYGGSMEYSAVEKEKKEEEQEETRFTMPVVDTYAQKTLRRKIVVDQLIKTLPEVLQALDMPPTVNVKEIKDLVLHFQLSSHNITFKPTEWNLVSFYLLKILSYRNTDLLESIQRGSTQQRLQQLLQLYGLQTTELDCFIEQLMDANKILKRMVVLE